MKTSILLTVAMIAAQTRAPVLSYLTVGNHRVNFATEKGATRLTSVREILGGPVIGDDDVSAATPTICYTVRDPAPGATKPMVLVFYGDDEGNGTLTQFELAPSTEVRNLKTKCASLPVSAKDVSTDLGVRIGLTREEVERKLGKPLREENGKTIYQSIDQLTIRDADNSTTTVEVVSNVDLTFRRGMVVAFGGGITDTE